MMVETRLAARWLGKHDDPGRQEAAQNLAYGRASRSSEWIFLGFPKGHAESPRSRDMLEGEWIIPQSFVLDRNHL